MSTMYGILFMAGLGFISCVYIYLTNYSLQCIEETIRGLKRLELEFDAYKTYDINLRNEMRVYESIVPKKAFEQYIEKIEQNNYSMLGNVKSRNALVKEAVKIHIPPKNEKLRYRLNRRIARARQDQKRCKEIGIFIKKLKSHPRNEFVGLKALQSKLSNLDIDYSDIR